MTNAAKTGSAIPFDIGLSEQRRNYGASSALDIILHQIVFRLQFVVVRLHDVANRNNSVKLPAVNHWDMANAMHRHQPHRHSDVVRRLGGNQIT